MTLTPEQLREAVELADGWSWIADMVADANGIAIAMNKNYGIASLASQLISQVEATPVNKFPDDAPTAIYTTPHETQIWHKKRKAVEVGGFTRDENSILACTEFLRSKGNE